MLKRLGIWAARLGLVVGMVAFTALTALFGAVSFAEMTGSDTGPGSEVSWAPPVLVVTIPLAVFCALLCVGCWALLVETFADESESGGAFRVGPRTR